MNTTDGAKAWYYLFHVCAVIYHDVDHACCQCSVYSNIDRSSGVKRGLLWWFGGKVPLNSLQPSSVPHYSFGTSKCFFLLAEPQPSIKEYDTLVLYHPWLKPFFFATCRTPLASNKDRRAVTDWYLFIEDCYKVDRIHSVCVPTQFFYDNIMF